MCVVETATQAEKQTFPYIPGYLGFREAPALVKVFNLLSQRPDVILVDGQGVSHPIEFGIATPLGLLLDIPTVGVAKSILVRKPEGILANEKGAMIPLVWKGNIIGMQMRISAPKPSFFILARRGN